MMGNKTEGLKRFFAGVPTVRYITIVPEGWDTKRSRPTHTLHVIDKRLVIDSATLGLAKSIIFQGYNFMIRTFVFGFLAMWVPPIALFVSSVLVIMMMGCIKFGKDNGKMTNGIYDAGIFAYVSLTLWDGILMYVFGRALGNLIESRHAPQMKNVRMSRLKKL